jgi:hypothetical protein
MLLGRSTSVRTAYILIQRSGFGDPLAMSLRAVPGVIAADDVMGPYDAIAIARHDPVERPLTAVVEEVLSVPGVTRALVASVIGSVLSLVDDAEFSNADA